METVAVSRALAALGHPKRLSVMRLLMRHAPHGVRPTEIADALAVRQNTLSSYLSDLEAAGLITSSRRGRSLYYSAALGSVSSVIDYLVTDFGRGRPDIMPSLPSNPTRERIMSQRVFNVLFICSGNSARSIFAESLLRDIGEGRFNAFSAGTRSNSELNPFALDVLSRNGHSLEGLRAKHISEFQVDDAPVMDFVFTVCDTAADEECPPWPGQPITGHWGLPDPVKATGTNAEKALAFAQTYSALRHRILAFTALPFASLDRAALQKSVDGIGLAQTEVQE